MTLTATVPRDTNYFPGDLSPQRCLTAQGSNRCPAQHMYPRYVFIIFFQISCRGIRMSMLDYVVSTLISLGDVCKETFSQRVYLKALLVFFILGLSVCLPACRGSDYGAQSEIAPMGAALEPLGCCPRFPGAEARSEVGRDACGQLRFSLRLPSTGTGHQAPLRSARVGAGAAGRHAGQGESCPACTPKTSSRLPHRVSTSKPTASSGQNRFTSGCNSHLPAFLNTLWGPAAGKGLGLPLRFLPFPCDPERR